MSRFDYVEQGAPAAIRTHSLRIRSSEKFCLPAYIERYGVYPLPYIGVNLSKQSIVSMVW